jgi:membrane-bound lytic murein transglycosylase A
MKRPWLSTCDEERNAVKSGCALFSILMMLLLAGCARGVVPVSTVSVPTLLAVRDGAILPAADDLDRGSLIAALERSLVYYDGLSESSLLHWGDDQIPVRDLKETLRAFREILLGDEPDVVKDWRIAETFELYRSSGMDQQGTVLFTGYYEPFLEGSLEKTDLYRFPLYGVPGNLIVDDSKGRSGGNEENIGRMENGSLIPYYSRAEIDEGKVLVGKQLEIAWVDDPVERFYLQMQGSGRIRLQDGTILRIGYAASNGLPFRSITSYLLDQGKITRKEASYQAFKKYLKGLSLEELIQIFNHNERYVFFRVMADGPRGSLKVPLTPGRSIATDAAVFPKGALAFIKLQKPRFDEQGNIVEWVPFARFVLSQDAGNAIRGSGRVDLFCGAGSEAERLAGSLKERGKLFLILKKNNRARKGTAESNNVTPARGNQ